METTPAGGLPFAERLRQPGWVAAHAVLWTLVIFAATELIRAASFTLDAPELASALVLSVALTVSLALLVAGLGLVDGVFFRRGRLLWVWVAALLAETALTSALTLYRVVTAAELQDRGYAQTASEIAPGLLVGAAFTLVVLGAAAALGVGVGTLVGRRRTSGPDQDRQGVGQ